MGLGYARTPLRGDRRLGAVVRNRQTHQLAVRNQSSLDGDAGAHDADPAFSVASEPLGWSSRTASTMDRATNNTLPPWAHLACVDLCSIARVDSVPVIQWQMVREFSGEDVGLLGHARSWRLGSRLWHDRVAAYAGQRGVADPTEVLP